MQRRIHDNHHNFLLVDNTSSRFGGGDSIIAKQTPKSRGAILPKNLTVFGNTNSDYQDDITTV